MDPESYRKRLKAIVGTHIRIEDIQTKLKLSQNRNSEERRALIAGLHRQDNAPSNAIADAMEQNNS